MPFSSLILVTGIVGVYGLIIAVIINGKVGQPVATVAVAPALPAMTPDDPPDWRLCTFRVNGTPIRNVGGIPSRKMQNPL